MPYALELALDEATAAVVRGVWRDLAAAGFPFMAESGPNPHVSLAIWDTIDHVGLEDALIGFAAATAPIDVIFARGETFPSTGVVFLAPDLDEHLLRVHARCHERFAALGHGAWAHYAPGCWAPHCTLAQDLDAGQITTALAIAAKIPSPLRGRLERVELVEFRPARCLATAPLTGAA